MNAPELFDAPDEDLLQMMVIVRAAKWAGVKAWELADAPAGWLDITLLCMDAEQEAWKRAKHGN